MTNPTGLPYTPAVAVGDWVVVSGQLGLLDGALVADFAGEVDQVLANLRDRLAEPRPDLSATGRPLCCYVTDNRSEDHRAPNRRAEIALELLDTPAVRTLLLSARAQMLGAKAPPPQGPPSQDAVTAAQLSAQVASEPTTQVASRNAAPAKAVEP